MKKAKEPTAKYYLMMSSLLCLSIILQSIVVVTTPPIFIRVINLISVIVSSGIVGAFIREVFILKEKEKQVMKK